MFSKFNMTLSGEKIIYKTANSEFSSTDGSIDYTFLFPDFEITIKLHVSQTLPVQGLLGYDFLSRFSVDFCNSYLVKKGCQKVYFDSPKHIMHDLKQDTSFLMCADHVDANVHLNENNVANVISDRLIQIPSANMKLQFDRNKFSVNPKISKFYQEKYYSLLQEFNDLFCEALGPRDTYIGPEKFCINLTNSRPQRGPVFEIPQAHKDDFF